MNAAWALVIVVIVKLSMYLVSQWIIHKRGRSELPEKHLKILQAGKKNEGASKIVVTGGSGFLGRKIVEQLVDQLGDKVFVVVLDKAAEPNPSQPHVMYLRGDVRLPSHVEFALTGAACVVHAAAAPDTPGTSQSFMRAVNVEGTKNIVETCLTKNVPRLVVTSTAMVHMSSKRVDVVDVKEDAPHPDKYLSYHAATKATAEGLALGAGGHVLRAVVLRPGYIYGRGDQHLLDAALRSAPVPRIGTKSRVPLVWVGDAAAAHVLAVRKLVFPEEGQAKMHGKAYHLVHDPKDAPALMQLMGGAAAPGSKKSVWGKSLSMKLNFVLVAVLAILNERLGSLLGFGPFHKHLSPEMLDVMLRDTVLDNSQARNLLGWSPTAWQQAVKKILADGADSKKGESKKAK